MHAAKLTNSPRLHRVLVLLKDKKPHTTMDIIRRAKVCAVSAIVSELRANGLDIHCARKGDLWSYRLV